MASDTNEGTDMKERPVFRDIRRYCCQYCGICRSKKTLIRSHILACHKDILEDAQSDEVESHKVDNMVQHTCQECGASFRKPAYLKQHMQGHSKEDDGYMCEALDPMRRTPKCEEAALLILNGPVSGRGTSCEAPSRKPQSRTFCKRPFACPVDDCLASYKRKDHLTRHSLTHLGKLFACPDNNCNRKFGIKANMKRHVREIHEDESPCEGQQQYVCDEPGCGKTFKYPSKLKKHEGAHAKLDCVEVVCCEPGCMKTFTNAECLRAHIRTCHQYVDCEICGTKQLKKNFKRHERTHEMNEVAEEFRCNFTGCDCTFSNASNLRQHIKVVHQNLRPFRCRFPRCGKRFPYKHVRDNHEKSGVHVYVQGNFVEADEYLRSRPRGGRKRKGFSVETLKRKRIVPPDQVSVLDDGAEYLRWLLSGDEQ